MEMYAHDREASRSIVSWNPWLVKHFKSLQ